MRATTIFDIAIRMLECQACGAPIAAPIGGGQVSCEYCRAVNSISVRRADAPSAPASMTSEVARLGRLKAQLDHPIGGHAYSLDRPPLGWGDGPPTVERLEGAWQRAKLAPGASPEEQRTLFWLAMKLADARQTRGQQREARATLETALDRLSDGGHRHLIRCHLSADALSQRDLEAADGWLRECDAAPEVLELDTAYRVALAWLRLMQGDASAVLAVVGTRDGDIPIHPAHASTMGRVRVHALEMLGHAREADAELEVLAARHGENEMLSALATEKLAPRARARREEARANAARQQGEQQLMVLSSELGSISSTWSHMFEGVFVLPVLALLLMIPVAASRCTADFDPLMGVHGHVICPRACDGCRGPMRTVTVWRSTGPGESSSNGAQYFCLSDENGIDKMSDGELESNIWQLGQWEIFLAPHGGTFLILLLAAIPLAMFYAFNSARQDAKKRAKLIAQIDSLAARLRLPPPRPPPKPLGSWALTAVGFLLATIAFAVFLVLVETAWR
jgi:hypothetical protein